MWGLPVAGVAVLLVGGPLAAQTDEGDPIVLSPRPPLEWIHFYDLDLALEFEWRANVTERNPAAGPSQRDVENRLRCLVQ